VKVHSALGKWHGLTDIDILNLSTISESKFQHKEWAALKYAYEWAILDGNEPEGDFMAEYRKLYSQKERDRINKLLRFMQFTNYCSNIFLNRGWKKESESLFKG